MLKSFSFSLPFIAIRIVLSLLAGGLLWGTSYGVNFLIILFLTGKVPAIFLTFLDPMGYIIGLGLGAYLVTIGMKPIIYYFKLAHIIYVTSIFTDYTHDGFFRFNHVLKEARENFATLAINDFATRGIVKILRGVTTSVKDSILNADIMTKIKEPESLTGKFWLKLVLKPINNVLNMVDEIVVSYVWLTYNMTEVARRDRNESELSLTMSIKMRSAFMAESIVLVVRLFPKLMILSLAGEVLFFILAHITALVLATVLITVLNFNIIVIVALIILYKTLLDIVYFGVIESLRLMMYVMLFYHLANKLDPIDFQEELMDLALKVPGLSKLMKKGGYEVPEGEPQEGSSLVDFNMQEDLRDALVGLGVALSIDSDFYRENFENDEEEDNAAVSPYISEQPRVGNTSNNEQDLTSSSTETTIDFSSNEDDVIIDSEEIQLGINENDLNDPFSNDTWNRN